MLFILLKVTTGGIFKVPLFLLIKSAKASIIGV